MRQLGEQRIVEIDGVRRMVKKVACENNKPCHGCSFGYFDFDSKHTRIHTCTCDFHCDDDGTYVYKDLGPVNDMGMLRIPFEVPEGYPLYPTIKSYSTSIEAKDSLFQVVYSNVRLHMAYGFFKSEQEAIDTWNRRS